MFCRNCTDEGYGSCKLFSTCKSFSNNNSMHFLFRTLAFTLDIRKTIMLTFGSLTFGTLIQVQFGKILLQSTH